MRTLLFIILSISLFASASAQEKAATKAPADTLKAERQSSCWTLIPPLGLRTPCDIDTLTYNYQRRVVPSMVSDAYATTGNFGAPGRNEIFMNRAPRGTFFFADALRPWLPQEQRFYNV